MRRYLTAYGPATREQYARWAGLRPAEAGQRIDALDDEVSVVELDGSRLWHLSDDVPDVTAATPTGTIRLLPRFDPYVIGAPRDKPAICPAEYIERVYQSNGWISAVLLVDGQMRGVWEYDQSRDGPEITIESFGSVTENVRNGAVEEAERMAEFLGGPLSLDWNLF